jgi:mxaA protein
VKRGSVKSQLFAALMLLISHAAFGAESAQVRATVQQPRSFGYVIGDSVSQRVLLKSGDREITPDALPSGGPAGIWLERRSARIESDARGRWLVLDYQIMNSPQALTMVTVPSWKIPSSAASTTLLVPEWRISVAPLTPRQPFTQLGLGGLRPDRSASLIDVTPLKRWLAIWSAAFAASILAWVGWLVWRNWQASSRLPFGVALRELRDVDENEPRAWHALHRAFDSTAGQVVRADDLGVLFERAPQLEPLRSTIERFFTQSAARFFGMPQVAAPLSVHKLCIELRQIEKRRET